MAHRPTKTPPGGTKEREDRLAEALRANLRRRKTAGRRPPPAKSAKEAIDNPDVTANPPAGDDDDR